MKKIWILLVLILVAVFGGRMWYLNKNKVDETNTIKIGALVPLSGQMAFEGKMVELNRKTLGENPKLRAAANQCIKEDSYNKLTMSTQELRDEGQEWLSAWQVVANTNKRSLRVRFFEDNRLTYNIGV